ncbi:MAG: glycosyltransferase [Patescibacteria group bacterium]|jgi:glycosyltransferase involved in cell wall biosynthesis
MLIDFCLPVKNEASLLEANVRRLFSYLTSQPTTYHWQIIILVNGSSDDSAAIANRLAQHYPQQIKSYHYQAGGKSLALKKYFNSSQADLLAFLDIDLAVAPEQIPELINPLLLNQADLVIGSRLVSGASSQRPLVRRLTTRFYNYFARLLFNNQVQDLQCGFKAFTAQLYQALAPDFLDNRWLFDTELIILALNANYRLIEIPVNWQEQRYASRPSQVKKSELWYFCWGLIRLRRRLNKLNQ